MTGLGVPILAATLLTARGLAEVERRLLPGVLGRPVARPWYPRSPEGAGFVRRATTPLRGGQSWLDLLYGIIIFPFSVVAFALTVALPVATLGAFAYPLWGWILRRAVGPENYQDLPQRLGVANTHTESSLFYLAAGLVLAFAVWPWAVRGCAQMRAHLARVLLTAVGEFQERIADLSESRAAAVSAEASALRRLERDIHDGPQQRLVHLAMELSRAQRQLGRDVGEAQETLDGAISATRETLDELRALSQGIAPPVLTDRGLPAALAALVSRSVIPVKLDTESQERFPTAVENVVYFVAAEALTNIAKHSNADSGDVRLSRRGNRLVLTVGDNGMGGAHTAKGSGLAGLAERVKAVEGEFVVESPAGGPTVVALEVPCG